MTISRQKYFLLIFVCLLHVSKSFAQENDAAFWPGIKLHYKYNKKIMGNLFIQERLQNNYTKHDNLFVDYCTSYELSKHYEAELAYVFVDHVNADKSQSFQHQIYFDITSKFKLYKKLHFKYTPLFQIQWTDVNSSPSGKIPDKYLRNKFCLEYKLKKRIEPFVFIEWRTNLKRIPYYVNRTRYCVGTSFHLHHKFDIDLYYMIQHGYNENTPDYMYISGINFSKEL